MVEFSIFWQLGAMWHNNHLYLELLGQVMDNHLCFMP